MAEPVAGGGDTNIPLEQYTIQTMNSSLMSRATRLFSVMTGEKLKMLKEIGFACLRRIGEWGRLDEHLTFWLLMHLDTEAMCIKTSRATVLPVTDVDVSLVMGTKIDGPYVYEEVSLAGEDLSLLLQKLFVPEDKGCLTMAHLETILCGDYDESSPEDERDSFKIAAVLYSWAMIFSVGGTDPVIPYGLWKYVSNTSKIIGMNWSALILKGVRNAVVNVQASIAAGDRQMFITGCPLFLQVFYIDNLDFGLHTIQNIYIPRIYQFTEKNIVGFIELDRDHENAGLFREYGATRALPHDCVVYCRSVTGFVGENVYDREGLQVSTKGQSSSLMQQLKDALKGNKESLDRMDYYKSYTHPSSLSTESIEVSMGAITLCKMKDPMTSSSVNTQGALVTAGSSSHQAMETAFKKGSVYNVFRRFKSWSGIKKPGPGRNKCSVKSRFRPTLEFVGQIQNVGKDQQMVPVPTEEPIQVVYPNEAVQYGPEMVDYTERVDELTVPFHGGHSPMDIEFDTSNFIQTDAEESSVGTDTNNGSLEMVVYVSPAEQLEVDNLAIVPYVYVKWVTSNSEYAESPFDLDLPQRYFEKKRVRAMYRVLLGGQFNDRVWFYSPLIHGEIIVGTELVDQMKRGGSYSSRLCDAIVMSHVEMEGNMYGMDRKHWKGYLPAAFSKIIFAAVGDEYLSDSRVREMFTGDHLTYDFEHCRKIVAPVEFDQSYSCYVWDLSAMDCQVLDPLLMNSSEKRAEEHHAWPVKFLTAALVKCVKTFFHGWRLLEGDWFMSASTNISQRCRPYNSAVYTLHYARWYDGIGIRKGITDAELGDIRGEMMYQIVVMDGNDSAFVANII